MSTVWKAEDFLAELVHLQKLHQLLPDETQHGNMVTGFLLKAQAAQKWNNQDIVALLEQTQELNFRQGMSRKMKDGITKLCQNEGSHVKLVQAGQMVSNLAPSLFHFSQWSAPDAMKKFYHFSTSAMKLCVW